MGKNWGQTGAVTGAFHFVGIGGIGMSGIAEVLHASGYLVTGSDTVESANVRRLRGLGIAVALEHRAENVTLAQVVVVSTAIGADNPEVAYARFHSIPVIKRAEMLAELMRLKRSVSVSGTHGKTTTTSLCAALLDTAHLDPTVVNGGIINAYGTNARLGKGEWFVAEADESDGSFLRLPATVAVVTNIDPEHMDHYGQFSNLVAAFEQFIHNLPFYGLAVLCHDHPVVREIFDRLVDRRKVSYGLMPGADIQATNIVMGPAGACFDVLFNEESIFYKNHRLESVRWAHLKRLDLPLYGVHNVQNALVLVAIAAELGLSEATLRAALSGFSGVKRRFTKVGVVNTVQIIDDYAHHPVEIQAVVAAARNAHPHKVIAVVQPHRYSRLSHLFDQFVDALAGADVVVVCPVYSAGEAPMEGVHHEALAQALKIAYPNRPVSIINGEEELAPCLASVIQPDDMVLCMGAGSISQWAYKLPEQLMALGTSQAAPQDKHHGKPGASAQRKSPPRRMRGHIG